MVGDWRTRHGNGQDGVELSYRQQVLLNSFMRLPQLEADISSSFESFGYYHQGADFKVRVSNWHQLGHGPNLGKGTSSPIVGNGGDDDFGVQLSKSQGIVELLEITKI